MNILDQIYSILSVQIEATTINKAINNVEAPVKQKHMRSTIISTFQEQGGQTFWSVINKLPVFENKIVSWKLCYVIHKVLREGHPLCLVHSQKHTNELEEIGLFWGNYRDGYGKMIKCYTDLLVTKIDFHRKNPIFSGHLEVTLNELDIIGRNDINVYFQMVVEMLDYIQKIVDLEAAILITLDLSRSMSMTTIGQCKLAPLVPCIQDVLKLYDYCIKFLYKLYAALPRDVLDGHKMRFADIHKKLFKFYETARKLEYVRIYIGVPVLPSEPPDFENAIPNCSSISTDLSAYEAKEVDSAEDAQEDQLDANDPSTNSVNISKCSLELLTERDDLINHLQIHSESLRTEISRLVNQHFKEVNSLHDKISDLELELAKKESELDSEKQLRRELLIQISDAALSPNDDQRITELKFIKTKDLYVKLTEEHQILKKEKEEIEKLLAVTCKEVFTLQKENSNLELKLKKNNSNRLTCTSIENPLLICDKDVQEMEVDVLKKSLTCLLEERNALEDKLNITNEENIHITSLINDLKTKLCVLETKIMTLKKEHSDISKNTTNVFTKTNIKMVWCAIREVLNISDRSYNIKSNHQVDLNEACDKALDLFSSAKSHEVGSCVNITNIICYKYIFYLVYGALTQHFNSNTDNYKQCMEEFLKLGTNIICCMSCIQKNHDVLPYVNNAKKQLKELGCLTESKLYSKEDLPAMLENEMVAMDKAVHEAAEKIERMLKSNKSSDPNIQYKVNEKILDACTKLMHVIEDLVEKAKCLEQEIISQGKVSSNKDFYKRNNQWTNGFISAANAVAITANFFVSAADKVVKGQVKLEELVVAAQEIAASTAQLVVASRVKADSTSKFLSELTQVSKDITVATGFVIATVRDCSQMFEKADKMNFTKLSLHQAKTMEIEAQVKVLELEKQLQEERLRLAALRRQHYQLAGEGEG